MTALLPLPVARAIGELKGEQARQRAEDVTPGFSDLALNFIREYALRQDSFMNEDCTLAMRAAGIVPHDDRAFGSIYAKAIRLRYVRVIGYAPRRRGHGAPGARRYAVDIGAFL
jgi:hypothetical protein